MRVSISVRPWSEFSDTVSAAPLNPLRALLVLIVAFLRHRTESFGGFLAGRLIAHDLTSELSLGHTCTVEKNSSAVGDTRVVAKRPSEVSICVKGARDNTTIEAHSAPTRRTNYIRLCSSDLKQTDGLMADAHSQNEPNPAGTIAPTHPDMMKELLAQVKGLSENMALIKKENETLTSTNAQYAVEAERTQAAGKRKREVAVDGTIKDFFSNLMDKFKTELQPHTEDLNGIVESMKENPASEPMIAAIECCAAQATKSTVELEAAYQENKRLKTELSEFTSKLAEASRPAFSDRADRVEIKAVASAAVAAPPAAAARHASIFSPAPLSGAPGGRAAGMKELNPGLWNDMWTATAHSRGSTGMPSIESFMKLKK